MKLSNKNWYSLIITSLFITTNACNQNYDDAKITKQVNSKNDYQLLSDSTKSDTEKNNIQVADTLNKSPKPIGLDKNTIYKLKLEKFKNSKKTIELEKKMKLINTSQ